MNRGNQSIFEVIVPTSVRPLPDKYEMLVAKILADKFQSDVRFVERSSIHTPDIQVMKTGEYWEVKNVKGNGKLTIEDNLRKATKQSCNVVISLLRSEMTVEKASSRINWHIKHAPAGLRNIILVTKRGKTIDFYV